MSNHSFDIHIATEYKSVEIAILVWHFQYWIMKNKRLNRNCIEGRTWTYQTNLEIASAFPYFSIFQVERLIKKAVELKILRKANYNKSQFDRTVWYAFEDEEKFGISRFREMEPAESQNGDRGIAEPIPDTLPDTLTNKERERAVPSARAPHSMERAKNVSTTEEEHQKLLAEHGESKTFAFYGILSDWKEDTPRSKWKKNDYRSILRWVVNAESERREGKKSGKESDEKVDRVLAEKVWIRWKGREQKDIIFCAKYLEFINGVNAPSTVLEFGSKDFRVKCLEQLRKRKLSTEGL